ncbi:MAG: sigma-70 family RNA polymerase sigma factor [Gemmataceae bacterium]|nr:sigma-70 family RNA polymerase sigma factor [Gemmataceae bacterium]
MPNPALALVLRHLRRATQPTGAAEPTDGHLLRRFVEHRDQGAFEALLERHAAMVWNVCRRVLSNPADADDAFQATFLVLVRKADSIAKHDSVSSWLHGVAYRVALDARAASARRRNHENQGAVMPTDEIPTDPIWSDVRVVLDEELRRLPEKYRAPLVLCYLQGKTNDEAADQLGWTRGTIAGRLSRARDLLRDRLSRRGLALTSALVASILTENAASAVVPAALGTSTVQAAMGFAATPGGASGPAVALAKGALHAMFVTRLKTVATLLAVLLFMGAGAGWLWNDLLAKPPSADPEKPAVPYSPIALADDPAQAKGDRPALVKGNTAFAVDLYGKLREKPGNLVYSPYSVSTALAMTYAGARNDTAAQMAQVMHFTLPQDRLHPAAGALVRDLSSNNEKKVNYQLNVVNALWGQKDYGFRDDFVKLTRTSYGAGLTEVDYVNAREEARKIINSWVEKQTQDKIKELLLEDHVTPDTRLILTNAIYFKAEWETKFYKNATVAQPFHISAAKKLEVPTMHRTAKFGYLSEDTFQVLEMPFVGKELSMVVLLPKKVDGLANLEKSLTADKLTEWQAKVKETEIEVSLPKFRVTTPLNLKDELIAMGMTLPFMARRADFSGMTNSREGLCISQVVHKTFVDVNEEGTEAAGATAVIMGRGAAPREAIAFNADHPFLFLIRDNRTGSVLFAGRVADPTK